MACKEEQLVFKVYGRGMNQIDRERTATGSIGVAG